MKQTDPRRRTLLGVCLAICCGFFIVELIAFLFLQERAASLQSEGMKLLYQVLTSRFALLSFGKNQVVIYAAGGIVLHAGIEALLSAALPHIRSRFWRV